MTSSAAATPWARGIPSIVMGGLRVIALIVMATLLIFGLLPATLLAAALQVPIAG